MEKFKVVKVLIKSAEDFEAEIQAYTEKGFKFHSATTIERVYLSDSGSCTEMYLIFTYKEECGEDTHLFNFAGKW